ncbi:SAM-dependent methyltransferase [Actinoplanes sp. SE50]|uniref:N5-glutamine methyltransferase family protein n=1 Tax=unclassified Actinoplanes TaxID=2626549 RepID=UPI00023ED280|nr:MULTISPECIES: class I SAM-dependent methyltransferase [unclassified Actinoplanes]AEV85584.1 Ribosomal protein L11 methyltransferase [Actinoplanes sp. SE50/110]ATO83977.1 SAM-dependent methyltransferase [Actinoplanes sp. SE50]SLM01387.1 SAM-dependent methyltransferase [Actinoplanes sp. SE50/110]
MTALLELGQALKAAGYEFTTVTPATHARVNARPANAEAHDLRDVFGWSRPFRPAVLPAGLLELLRAADAVEADGELLRSRVRFSTYDGDLFLHSAFPTDAADSVFFGPDTYRMADAVAAHLESRAEPVARAVDIGCGTGAGAITIAKRAPGAEVLAVDINDTALRYAQINARLAGTPGVTPRRSDLLDHVDGDLDLIVSNPPFMVDPAGRTYRDGGGADGNDLSLRIVDAAAKRLAPGGALVLFSGTGIVGGRDPLHTAAAERLSGTDLTWTYREVDPDVYGEELDGPAYAHAERIAVVLLTATRPW